MKERRAHERRDLSFRVLVRVRQRDGWRELSGTSENVSIQGVLFRTDGLVECGDEIEVRLSLLGRSVSVTGPFCAGRVIRIEPRHNGTTRAVAVQCHDRLDIPSA